MVLAGTPTQKSGPELETPGRLIPPRTGRAYV